MRRSRFQSSGSYMPRRRPGNTTPYMLDAKWGGVCKCGTAIKPGDRIMYYPSSRAVECEECSTETRMLLADERGGL